MRAEIICIGTELLLGQIINSNAAFLGAELGALGIDCYFQTVVGDNKERIKESFKLALKRADLILTTGGLGPTSDDLTTECWAEFFEQSLVLDPEVLKHIEELFAKRNRPMAASNRKQALRPNGANLLSNPVGTAPGIVWDVSELCKKYNLGEGQNKLIMTFPGVPRELKAMWSDSYRLLAKKMAGEKVLVWKELKFYGIGESLLAEKVQDLLDLNDPTVAPLAGHGECRLRLATKAGGQEEGLEKLKKFEETIRERVGEFIYGENADTLESLVAYLLKTKKQTLAIAESCTGGLLSQRLTEIPGSSEYTLLNIVTYSNESKKQILNVSQASLEHHGAVSEEVAYEMASGIKKLAGSDYGVSLTGIAGPDGGTTDKPVGTVYIGLATPDKLEVKNFSFGKATREDIRWLSTQEALNWLRQVLQS
jgi:nicotinamide-nucleotide amidase